MASTMNQRKIRVWCMPLKQGEEMKIKQIAAKINKLKFLFKVQLTFCISRNCLFTLESF
jgi:hypothetical protein